VPDAPVTITGLGPAGLELLPAANLKLLAEAPRLLLRTERHPAAVELRAQGTAFTSLDALYGEAPDFGALYPRLAQAVLEQARQGPLVYAVPGHPLMGEESVRLILRLAPEAGIAVRVVPAPGFVDVVLPLLVDAGEVPDLTEWQVADGAAVERVWWDPRRPTLLFQVDDARVASRVKLALLGEYPESWPVCVVRNAGVASGRARQSVRRVPLFELDRKAAGKYDHLTTLYVPPLPEEQRRPDFQSLVDVVARLRAPDGCPWDREQTYASLKRFVLEEAYEVLEAIDSEDPATLCEELGDFILQAVMLAQLAREDGYFEIRDSLVAIVEKLIRRHPHVFGDVAVENADEVLKNWESIKRTEKPERESVLDGVPRHLPALMKALEVSKRAVKVGFEWPSLAEVLDKVDEEVRELRAELSDRDPARLHDEVGDLLFTVVNVARWLKVDPEEALRQMVDRFSRRFREVERLAAASGRSLTEMTLGEMDALWEQAKGAEAPAGC
jgi:tetrapyrrole methylase family protein/MazG family protein